MSTVDEVKTRLDIVDVVSGYVTLQKAGRNFKALCPFHTEKTPSFVVNRERQSWRCFGACATGGDAFSFVMRTERVEFGEALRTLAQRAGVELTERRDSGRYDTLYRINQEAVRFYSEVLESDVGQPAMAYLKERAVDSKARAAFSLGLSPGERSQLSAHLLELGFGLDQAVEAGLLRRSENGSYRDFFWGRLMFPIHDQQGRVTGFGGRTLDGSEPKYINTPTTPTFDKRATLYGLHLAADFIKDQDTAVVVEGYMDVIAAHQHGYTNVVASMGTALTEQQVNQLKSKATKFVLALDPDAAGQEATRRSLESSWRLVGFERQQIDGRRRSVGPLYRSNRPDLRIATLPTGRDPDDLIRNEPSEWGRLIDEAVPFVDFALPAFAALYDLSNEHGKAQAAEALLPLVTATGNAFDQERYFRMLAKVLGVSPEALQASIGRPRAGGVRAVPRRTDPTRGPTASPLAGGRQDMLEDYVLALLLGQPALKERAQSVAPEYFRGTENKEVFTCWLGCTTIEELEDSLDGSLRDHLEYLLHMDLAPADPLSYETALDQSLRRLEQRHLQDLQELLLATEDVRVAPPKDLADQIVGLNARLKELFSHQA